MTAWVSSMVIADDHSRAEGCQRRIGEMLATPVRELGLSVRALRVLNDLHIECVRDLVRVTPEVLSTQRNCGRRTIAEISDLLERHAAFLDRHGVPLSRGQPSADEEARAEAGVCTVEETERLPLELRAVLLRRVSELRLSRRALNAVTTMGITYVGDLVHLTPSSLLQNWHFGRKSLREVERILDNMGLSLGMTLHGWDRDIAAKLEKTNEAPDVKVVRFGVEVFDQLPLDRKVSLLRRVGELLLSMRALNTLATLGITYVGDLVQLTRPYLLRSRNFGRKTLREIECVFDSMGLSLGMTLLDWDRDLAAGLEKRFERELNEVRLQEIDRRFWPNRGDNSTQMELLETTLLEFLRTLTGRRNAEILHRLYGWDGLGPRTLESVGQEYGITRERVRQIAASG
jgi:DNA-directed RNA polymerase alpha subunit